MTLHIFVSLVTLGLLWWNLYSLTISIRSQRPASWLPLAGMLPLLIVMSYGPFVPLSHFVFEFSSDNVLWYSIVYGLLWLLTGYFLWRYKKAGTRWTLFGVYSVLWAIMGFWYFLGLTLSRYEPGVATPGVMDAPIYIVHWASIHLTIIVTLSLLFFSSQHRHRWVRTTISIILLTVYVFATLGQLLKLI